MANRDLNDADPRFRCTQYFVEADAFTRAVLWSRHAKESKATLREDDFPRYEWEGNLTGISLQLGECDGRPVCVLFFWALINGAIVCFYDATSEVVDWKLIEASLEGTPACDQGRRTDACNFGVVLNFAEDQSKSTRVASLLCWGDALAEVRNRVKGGCEPWTTVK